MRDDILNILKNSDRALDIYELQDMLHINDVNQAKELSDELRKLEDEVVVYHSNKNKYMMLEKSHLRKGVMRINKKGFGFVEIENMDDDEHCKEAVDELKVCTSSIKACAEQAEKLANDMDDELTDIMNAGKK